ncbi:DNA-binding protein [Methylorubrum rhodesianum]|uniref:DNA-binding protein n=2 Tax=Methylobacteriaceae TaxID=119045 RepID=UPI003D08DB03
MFEVPAGGRRYRALQHLVKTKRFAKTGAVPCIVREADSPISAEEDSLAENTMREALHPLDQFRAFKALIDTGLGEEEIAARFFVTPAVVKQRLRLVTVSPKLLEVYAESGMTLEQLMAFSVSPDHAHQEQVWAAPSNGWNKEPHSIRRQLTEGHVEIRRDRRALFVGVEAYEAAGGEVLRDLFSQDGDGWMKDVPLLSRLAQEKLQAITAEVLAEGWRWVEAAESFPYNHTYHLRRLEPAEVAVIEDAQGAFAALQEEYERLEQEYQDVEELPEEVDARLGELEQAIETFEGRQARYSAEQMAYAGAFVSIGYDGKPAIDRGWVRRQDEPRAAEPAVAEGGGTDVTPGQTRAGTIQRATFTVGGAAVGGADVQTPQGAEPEDEDGERPLSARLIAELTTQRTVALREALSNDPDAAFLAVLHALALGAFYRGMAAYAAGYSAHGRGAESCLEIQFRSTEPGRDVPNLAEAPGAIALERRRREWQERLPKEGVRLWDALLGLDPDSRADLFALCAGLSLNAMQQPHDGRAGAIAHADRVAELVGLDMTEHWQPTKETFFGHVTKGRILAAVREAKGEAAAQLIDHLKRSEMAEEATRLVEGTGWLPQPLRTPGLERSNPAPTQPEPAPAALEPEEEALPAFLADEGEVPAAVAGPEPGEEPQVGMDEDRSWDIDAFEGDPESLEPDAEARALADAERRDDEGYYGIAAE